MMKKYLLILGAVSLIIIGLSSSAFSYTYTFGEEVFSVYKDFEYDYGTQDGVLLDPAQGEYLGTVYDGNDDEDTLMDVFEKYLGWNDPVITFYGKDEDGELLIPQSQSNGEDEDELISGTWQTYSGVEPINPDCVEFIIVKAGNNFSIHRYDPSASSGEWNIGYLPDAGNSDSPATLSHMSAYNGGSTPVPEPATILLLGSGLLGLVGHSRKRFSKKS